MSSDYTEELNAKCDALLAAVLEARRHEVGDASYKPSSAELAVTAVRCIIQRKDDPAWAYAYVGGVDADVVEAARATDEDDDEAPSRIGKGGRLEPIDPEYEKKRSADEDWAKRKGFETSDDATDRCTEHAERLVRAVVDLERYDGCRKHGAIGIDGIPKQMHIIAHAIRWIVGAYLDWYSEPIQKLLAKLEEDPRAALDGDDGSYWTTAIELDVPGRPWVPFICSPNDAPFPKA
jgi:hypothetical protein